MLQCEAIVGQRVGLLLPLHFDGATFGFGSRLGLNPFGTVFGPFGRFQVEIGFPAGELGFALRDVVDQCGAMRFELLFTPRERRSLRLNGDLFERGRFRFLTRALQFGFAIGQFLLSLSKPKPRGANFIFLLRQLRVELRFAAIKLILLGAQMASQLFQLQLHLLQFFDRELFFRNQRRRRRMLQQVSLGWR